MTSRTARSPQRRPHQLRSSTEVDLQVGTLTHEVVQTVLADTWPQHLEQDLPMRVIREAVVAVGKSDTPGNQKRRTIVRVASNACSYLVRYCPPVPVEFLGAEYQLGEGRVDLLWGCPDDLRVIDELKTSRHSGMPKADRAQVSEYALAGHHRFGAQFAGVRYLPLLHPQCARLFTSDGHTVTDVPLAGTPFAWGLMGAEAAR